MSEAVLETPYSYVRLESIKSFDPDKKAFPLVLYFMSNKERAEFARATKAAIKQRGKYRTSHLT